MLKEYMMADVVESLLAATVSFRGQRQALQPCGLPLTTPAGTSGSADGSPGRACSHDLEQAAGCAGM